MAWPLILQMAALATQIRLFRSIPPVMEEVPSGTPAMGATLIYLCPYISRY